MNLVENISCNIFFPSSSEKQQLFSQEEAFLKNLSNVSSTSLLKNVSSKMEETFDLAKRVQKKWFLSSDLKRCIQNIEHIAFACKVAKKFQLPIKPLFEDRKLCAFLKKNHLYHKITLQHQQTGVQIKYENGKFLLPCAKTTKIATNAPIEKKTVYLDLDTILQRAKHFYKKSTGKIQDLEYLSNGLEIHSRFHWKRLRPLYKLSEENGKYIHFDTITGEKEIIGDVGKDYFRVVNVLPWGWNPIGGSLFGHTWTVLVLNGSLYHIGANLRGYILNPDFMASIPAKGKTYQLQNWAALKIEKDTNGYSQGQRLLTRLENLQAKLEEKNPIHSEIEDLYGPSTYEKYLEIRNKLGGTCTSASLKLSEELRKKEVTKKKNCVSFITSFLQLTKRCLDIFWSYFPRFFQKYIIRPIQIVTRGKKPREVHLDKVINR